MRPYIIKKHKKYIINLGMSLFGCLFFTISLLLAPYYLMVFIALFSLFFYTWFIYSLQQYIKFKKKGNDYDALVISENGIKYEDDKGFSNIAWENISKITIQKKGESRYVWAELEFSLSNGKKSSFSLEPYMQTINIFRLRKALIYFSKRKDIVSNSCSLWLLI